MHTFYLLPEEIVHWHSDKYGEGDDVELPPGGGGCPLGPEGMPLKGGLLREAAVNLFGSVIVKMCAPGEKSEILRGCGAKE
jgi:hypothetical protein